MCVLLVGSVGEELWGECIELYSRWMAFFQYVLYFTHEVENKQKFQAKDRVIWTAR